MGLLRDEEILLVAKFLLIPTTRKKSTQVDSNRFSLQKKMFIPFPLKFRPPSLSKKFQVITQYKLSS